MTVQCPAVGIWWEKNFYANGWQVFVFQCWVVSCSDYRVTHGSTKTLHTPWVSPGKNPSTPGSKAVTVFGPCLSCLKSTVCWETRHTNTHSHENLRRGFISDIRNTSILLHCQWFLWMASANLSLLEIHSNHFYFLSDWLPCHIVLCHDYLSLAL